MGDARANSSGKCLCGHVSYRTTPPLRSVLQCHCENCRRLSGNFVAGARAATAELHIEDPLDHLRWYDLGYARYGFCVNCGASLFYRAADREGFTAIMVGTLDDASQLTLEGVWFAEDAQPHNALPAGVPLHEGNG